MRAIPIGKSSMIFLDALDRKPALPGDENRSPLAVESLLRIAAE
jgi:hypothetical protein